MIFHGDIFFLLLTPRDGRRPAQCDVNVAKVPKPSGHSDWFGNDSFRMKPGK